MPAVAKEKVNMLLLIDTNETLPRVKREVFISGSSATMSKVEMSRRIEMEPFLWGQGDARTFFEVLFNVGAFLFFVLLLQNLIIGIIFDQA